MAARVGDATVSWGEINDRAAIDHLSACAALDRWVEEELLVLAVCADEPAEPACRARDRTRLLAIAANEALGTPSPEEVEAVSRETPFLEERRRSDPGLPRALAAHRSAHRALSERAGRQRTKTPVVVPARCQRGGTR